MKRQTRTITVVPGNTRKVVKNAMMTDETKRAIAKAIAKCTEEQPEIVRCKDCKYVECEGIGGFLVCDLSGFSHYPEFFCADGERR